MLQGGGMRKVAKKMREEAEKKEESIVTVRREDESLRPFTIPYAEDVTQMGGSGSALMTIREIVLPGSTAQSIKLRAGPIALDRYMHVRIRGPNGIGKTTLLDAIANNRLAGVSVNPKVQIGYYRQDFDNLDFDGTVLDCLYKASADKHTEQQLRSVAASFFLTGDKVKQKIYTLSEGQKGLVSLACLVLQEPGILIMDEPTNHINFRHLPALAEALSSYAGALILVSHDADFVKKIRIDQEIDLEYELRSQDLDKSC